MAQASPIIFAAWLPGDARLVVRADWSPLDRWIEEHLERLRDIRPLLVDIAGIIRRAYGRNFAEGGRPDPWEPLAPSTVKAKMRQGLPARTAKGNIPWRLKQQGEFGPENILIGRGRYRDSFRLKRDPDHLEEYDLRNGKVTVGSRMRTPNGKWLLAEIHQYGRRDGKMPARPQHITQDDIAEIQAAVYAWFNAGKTSGAGDAE